MTRWKSKTKTKINLFIQIHVNIEIEMHYIQLIACISYNRLINFIYFWFYWKIKQIYIE